MLRSISGGILLQDEDEGLDADWKSVTKVEFTKEKNELVHFGIMAVKHLKSNAIALVRETKDGDFSISGNWYGSAE